MDTIQDEKENANIGRVQRTKKDQFDLIVNFFKVNNESLMDTDEFKKKWSELVVILNSVGPPIHSCSEWRRVWSDRKYNNKRKRSSLEGSSESANKALVVPNVKEVSVGNVSNDHSNMPDAEGSFNNDNLLCDQVNETTVLSEYNNKRKRSSLEGSSESANKALVVPNVREVSVGNVSNDHSNMPDAECSFNNHNLLYDQVNETTVLSEYSIETPNTISVEPIQSTQPAQRNFVDENTSLLGDLNYFFLPNVVNSNNNLLYNNTTTDTTNRIFAHSADYSGQSTTDSGKPIEFTLQSTSSLHNEIISKLSDLLKRLDVIISNQIETITLLKELGKLK